MVTYKTKKFLKTKEGNNTLWLDKLINQLEKQAKRVWLCILSEMYRKHDYDYQLPKRN